MKPTHGCYIKPEDAIEDQLDAHVHRDEGVCWIGPAEKLDEATGEIYDLFGTVRVHHGFLKFGAIKAAEVGTVLPPSGPTLDGIIKLAGKEIMRAGRLVHERYPGVIHVLYGVVRNMPQAEAPSIFDPLPGHDNPEEDSGWVLGGTAHLDAEPGSNVKAASGRMMLGKLDTIRALDPLLVAEVHRAGRAAGLPHLADGVELTLSQTVAYDEILRRWERTAAAHATAANHETREL